jgi:hypothetical protein
MPTLDKEQEDAIERLPDDWKPLVIETLESGKKMSNRKCLIFGSSLTDNQRNHGKSFVVSTRYRIVCKHSNQFLDRGITVEKIADVVVGRQIGGQGHGDERPTPALYYNNKL